MLLPTTVVGSHAWPGWYAQAQDAIAQGLYGPRDLQELRRDAVTVAVEDQQRAGIDLITDGEMGRLDFNLGFYNAFTGLRQLPIERRLGVPAHDQRPKYEIVGDLQAPNGLGVVEEFLYLKSIARARIKAAVPGPFTLSGRLAGADRIAIAERLVPVVRREMERLVAAGCDHIQLDEPSFACYPDGVDDYVRLFNATASGIQATLSTHLCFGNYKARAVAARRYRPLFPKILEICADELILEFASREMAEVDLWKEFAVSKRLAAGVVDVKSSYLEPPEEIARRARLLLQYVPADKLSLCPDCGFSQTARHIAVAKLRNLVEGARLVRC
ncbi:MAG: cobalamin-independent methionine synthase II family protein [Acidobacteria bacterium]|nr:cobalamin-independent methionine synthase II family protein [Acidobacteriota bacterium]